MLRVCDWNAQEERERSRKILRLCFTDNNSRWWMNIRSQSCMQMSSNVPQLVVAGVRTVYAEVLSVFRKGCYVFVPRRIKFFSRLSKHWVSYYSRSVTCTKEKIKFALLVFQLIYYGLSQNSLEPTVSVLHVECQATLMLRALILLTQVSWNLFLKLRMNWCNMFKETNIGIYVIRSFE